MIEDGISPKNILLFTFTKKAANEIKERVYKKIGPKSKGITVGTYHSFCSKLLRLYADKIGWTRNYSIYDEDDKKKLLKELCKKTIPAVEPQNASQMISHWRMNLVSPSEALLEASGRYFESLARIYQQYSQRMKANNAFDFDGLIYYTIELLDNYPEVKEAINSKYTYITCDEAHDSSPEDLHLIELLGGKSMNVCLILDADQSIYSFRGANMGSVYDFMKTYNFKQFMLEQNYRSTKTIVNASRSMIKNNDEPIKKTVFTENEVGNSIMLSALTNSTDEANHVVRIVKALKKKGMAYKDMAILYRMQFLSRRIEKAMLKNRIPYKITGGLAFYARQEIKDIMAYVRFLLNPNDSEALRRIINVPKRGIGDKTLEKVFTYADEHGTIDNGGLLFACKNVKVTKTTRENLNRFIAVIETLTEYCLANSPEDIVKEIINMVHYEDYISETAEEELVPEKLANLVELREVACNYVDLADFSNNVIMNTQMTEEQDEDDYVNLMTMHASKGLEFPAVIIVGANEEVVPHIKAIQAGDISEERRLFYVGMTRAEKYLFITYPTTVLTKRGVFPNKPSRFIKEINSQYVVKT